VPERKKLFYLDVGVPARALRGEADKVADGSVLLR